MNADDRKRQAARAAQDLVMWGPRGRAYWKAERAKQTEDEHWDEWRAITDTQYRVYDGKPTIDIERLHLDWTRKNLSHLQEPTGDDARGLGYPFNGRGKGIYHLMQAAGELPKDGLR